VNRLVNPFQRFDVRYHTTGGTSVAWEIDEKFTDPLPHTYQLQGGYGSVDTTDWANIGLPANNVFRLVDDEQRIYGKSNDWYYRVVLSTPNGTYTSKPLTADENLDFRSWRLAQDMIRKERLLLEHYTGVECVLLKRKRYGVRCARCTDPLTEEVTEHDCPVCEGTGKVGGYFAGVPGVFVMIPPSQGNEQQDGLRVAGTVKEIQIPGCVALGEPVLDTFDVLVDTGSDKRYVVRGVGEGAVLRDYPIKLSVTLKQLPFSDRAYSIPLEGS
jgi:hypothetical protein